MFIQGQYPDTADAQNLPTDAADPAFEFHTHPTRGSDGDASTLLSRSLCASASKIAMAATLCFALAVLFLFFLDRERSGYRGVACFRRAVPLAPWRRERGSAFGRSQRSPSPVPLLAHCCAVQLRASVKQNRFLRDRGKSLLFGVKSAQVSIFLSH